MSTDTPASLAGQREALREQLQAQRQALALKLTPAGDAVGGGVANGYPRSITMRWLIREPELVGKAVGHLVGGRAAAAIPAVFLVARLLRSVIALR